MSVYIIAEIGNTHEGSLGLAKQFIKVAAECGVDCVKFQTHLFDFESLPDAPNPPYFKDETRKEYFERTAFSLAEYKKLKQYCTELGVDFMSSPFSLEAVDLLEQVDMSAYKIPSGEVTNLPLLSKIAKTGKRVLLSSGMSTLEELDRAYETLVESGAKDIVVLQCVSEYPCPPEHSGLNLIEEFRDRYKTAVGYSDHTLGAAVPLAAVVKGAVLIEKHFTLSREMYGSDARNSTTPKEFKDLVDQIRDLEKALDYKVDKNQSAETLHEMKFIFEKTIVASHSLKAGTIVTFDDLSFKKPKKGICASKYKELIGKELVKSLAKDEVLSWEVLK